MPERWEVETFEQVVSVQVVNLRGEFDTLRPEEMQVQYRNVPTLRDRYAVSAIFRGERAGIDAIDRRLIRVESKKKEDPADRFQRRLYI